MGIKFHCPNGHKLNVKSFLAGKRGICPHCGAKFQIPDEAGDNDQAYDDPLTSTAETSGGTATAVASVGTRNLAETAAIATTSAIRPVAANPVAAAQPVSPSLPLTAVQPVGTPVPVSPVGQPVGVLAPSMAQAVGAAVMPAMPIGAPLSPYTAMPSAPADPIAEAPNAVWYVRPPSGGQFGPARGDIMRKWLGEGRVSADSLVWRDGWPDWKNAAAVFPALGPQVPSPGSLLAATPSTAGVTVPSGSSANSAANRAYRAKKRSNGMAVAMVVTLGLISVVLLVLFIVVISGLGQN